PEEAGQRFSDMGIALRAGMHCSPLAHKTLGTFPEGTVRLSVSAFTSAREIDAFLNVAEDISKRN
ncbi:MAG: aminotransferase class V-fold PLP-dependent enzyme, partial [Oscillospiraceae bacterium]|nr:aminotransferase class V-fold PLP-dependent enzyme [Oscillospiraceae bacterium]